MAKDRYYDNDTMPPRREQDKYFANMPDKDVMKEYPHAEYGLRGYYNDSY